jgi:5-methylcytosine-specific restriction endonuclease McrA
MAITKTAFPGPTRRRVLLKTGGTCIYCGKKLDLDEYNKCAEEPRPNGAWEVDHWIPRSFFNTDAEADVIDNLWPACCACNDEKTNTTGEAYIAKRKATGRQINPSVAVMKRFQKRSSP